MTKTEVNFLTCTAPGWRFHCKRNLLFQQVLSSTSQSNLGQLPLPCCPQSCNKPHSSLLVSTQSLALTRCTISWRKNLIRELSQIPTRLLTHFICPSLPPSQVHFLLWFLDTIFSSSFSHCFTILHAFSISFYSVFCHILLLPEIAPWLFSSYTLSSVFSFTCLASAIIYPFSLVWTTPLSCKCVYPDACSTSPLGCPTATLNPAYPKLNSWSFQTCPNDSSIYTVAQARNQFFLFPHLVYQSTRDSVSPHFSSLSIPPHCHYHCPDLGLSQHSPRLL